MKRVNNGLPLFESKDRDIIKIITRLGRYKCSAHAISYRLIKVREIASIHTDDSLVRLRDGGARAIGYAITPGGMNIKGTFPGRTDRSRNRVNAITPINHWTLGLWRFNIGQSV